MAHRGRLDADWTGARDLVLTFVELALDINIGTDLTFCGPASDGVIIAGEAEPEVSSARV